MKVIESKILIKVINEGAYKKIGNLEIPENTLGYETGEVISVGAKVEEVKVGDKIRFYPGTGKEIVEDGIKYRVITTSEVIVIL